MLLWVAVALGILVGFAILAEWLYRRRHPYVIGLRPFSARRYARYLWGRVSRLPAETERVSKPYREWFPLVLQKPLLLRFFRRWNRLRKAPGGAALDTGLPWLAFEAIDWLDRYLEPGMRAFEWGSGGSTLYLARRVEALVTIEHNATWYERVSRRLESEAIANCRYLLHEPRPGSRNGGSAVPGGYVSADKQFSGLNFREYCSAIDEHADESFDVVVVDGRARPSCIFHARNKVRRGGVMVVDNSERPDYAAGLELLGGWSRRDFAGPAPFYAGFSTTSIFVR